MDKEKFLGEIKSAVSETVDKKVDEKLQPLNEKIEGLDEKVAKLESLPVEGKAPALVSGGTYKGYKLSKQLENVRNLAHKRGDMPFLASDERAEDFAKFVIAIKNLKKNGDASAREDIAKFQEKYIEKAALQEGTASEGGYLVPDEYLFDIIALTRDKFFAINSCSVVNMGTDTLRVPKEASLVSVSYTAEESAATQTEPTFDELVLTAKRLDGYGIVSNELLQDSAVDLVGMLTEQFSYAINREHDNQVLNGTGDPVSGVLTAVAGFSVTLAGNHVSSISGDNLSDAIQKVDEGFADNGMFVVDKLPLHYIRTLKDSQNNYIWASIGGGQPNTIWQHPYTQSTKAPDGSSATTAFSVFGDFKQFYIGRRLGATSLDLDPYGKFTTYQTQFRMVTRWAYGLGQANAFCRFLTA